MSCQSAWCIFTTLLNLNLNLSLKLGTYVIHKNDYLGEMKEKLLLFIR